MFPRRLIVSGLLAYCTGVAAFAQRPAPVGDRVESELSPGGISRLPVHLNGPLAYAFKDREGTDVFHCLGDCIATIGEHDGQTLRAREAVVWINNRVYDGRPFRHLQILLWRDAEIREPGGTVTSSPVLFVTLNTFADISASVDELAYQPSTAGRAYRQGDAIRKAITPRLPSEPQIGTQFQVFDASGLPERQQPVTPPPLIRIQSQGELALTETEDGTRVLTITGGVYLSRGTGDVAGYLEIQADAVVVFLPPSTEVDVAGIPGALGPEVETVEPAERKPPSRAAGQRSLPPSRSERTKSDRQRLSTGLGEMEVEAAYLEGDVVMRQGPNMIRASRLYYDFLRDKAVILDAVVRTTIARRNIPLYVRAAEIRQLSRNHFTATDALLTTSEFHTPHYHVGASRVELIDRTPPGIGGRREGIRAGTFSIRNATLNLEGYPLLYWPYVRGDVDTSETAIKSVRGGFSDEFGVELETEWHLFNVLGLETPEGFDSTLSLDYFTRRGPAVGAEALYERDTYFGLLRSYLLADGGQDFLGRERERLSEKDVRGRLLFRHRHYLEEEGQLSLELSYISDRGFLEEFFESEFDNEKEQETLLYFKKQRENRAVTALLQPRILDFVTQTERLPDLAAFIMGEPAGQGATWYSENRLGVVRYRPAEQTFREFLRDGRADASGSVVRADSRQEISIPFDTGPVRWVPFLTVRGTAWDDSPNEGGMFRAFAAYGLRGSMYLSRVYPEARSTLFDIDGIRHVVKPDITAWVSHTNRDPAKRRSRGDAPFLFDETVEGIEEADGIALGVRQRWQTKRGRGKTRRTVDFLILDLELGIFNGADSDEITNGFVSYTRPENSISRSYLNSSFIWRVNDRTALLSEMNYDLNDGEIDILNVSLAVERSPRMNYLLGYRLIEESDSELLGFDLNYRLTEKHSLAVTELFDLDRGRILDFTVALIRRFPHWFGAVSFAFDDAEDDFGVSLSIWPEGLPQATLGSRRFRGFAGRTRWQAD